MSHELEILADGSAAMFSHRILPWHRLGTVVDTAPTSAEALKLAHLDWDVTTEPVYVMTADGFVPIDSRRATVRPNPDTGAAEVLGVVGTSYTPIQNVEAFEFLDTLVAESDAPITYETAGSLQNGRRIFMSMKVPHDVKVAGESVDLYLLATTSHDGSDAFRVAVTPVRPVCMNTVVAGLRRARQSWSVRHTTNVRSRISEAQSTLRLTFAYADALEAEAAALYETAVTDKQFANVVAKFLPIDSDASDLVRDAQNKRREQVAGLWDASTQNGIRGTAWGVYNTLTEWVDWGRTVRNPEQKMTLLDRRGVALKSRAFELAGSIKSTS